MEDHQGKEPSDIELLISQEEILKKMPVRPVKNKSIAHSLANIIYWISFAMLLVAARELISPGTRKAGEITHIYITLASFEIYMWLLVALNQWHFHKRLLIDSSRSMIFVIALSGFLFMALDELYLISGRIGMAVSVAAMITCLLRMKIMFTTVSLSIPRYLLGYIAGWLVLLALPTALFKKMDSELCFVNSVLYCWVIAIYLASHVFALKKQRQQQFHEDKATPFQNWYAPWCLLAMLFGLAVAQCVSVTYIFADFSYWYFSPIFITMAILGIGMAFIYGKGKELAWATFGASLIYIIMAAGMSKLPNGFPDHDQAGTNSIIAAYYNCGLSFLLNPYIPALLQGSLMFALCGLVLSYWWMLLVAAIVPVAFVSVKTVDYVSRCKNGRGFSMLLIAFLLLGGGVAIQWAQEKWGKKKDNLDQPGENGPKIE